MPIKWNRRLVGGIYICLILFYLTILGFHVYFNVKNPFQIDYGEGIISQFALAYRSGVPIYPNPSSPPYWICPYTPLFFVLQSKLIAFFSPISAGRFLSSVSTFGIVLSLAYLLRPKGWSAVAVGTIIFLANPVVLCWGTLARIDMLALFLAFIGMQGLQTSGSWKREAFFSFFLVLAFFTKQSYVGPALAVFLSRWRDPRSARQFAALYASQLMTLLLIAWWQTHGELINLLVSRTSMKFVPESVTTLLLEYVPYLLVPAVVVIPKVRKLPLIWLIFLFFGLCMIVGTGRFGAYFNYYLEFHLAVSILSGLAWSEEGGRPPGLDLVVFLHALLPGMFLSQGYLLCASDIVKLEIVPYFRGDVNLWFAMGAKRQVALQPILSQKPTRVVAENAGDWIIWGIPTWYCDPSTYFGMEQNGRWDEEPMLQLIREGQIDAVVLERIEGNSRFSPVFLQTVQQFYQQVNNSPESLVFVPKEKASLYRPDLVPKT